MKDYNIKLYGEKVDLRLIQLNDKDLYYRVGFEHEDTESAYFTGSTEPFTQEMTDRHIDRIVGDESRYDFLIFSKDGRLLGEVVINEIAEYERSANFRIAIFNSEDFGKGYGTEATRLVLKFAFETLHLHRVELDVYDYNLRARHVYEKLGFVQEGVKRDVVLIGGSYHDVILMSMLESDYYVTMR